MVEIKNINVKTPEFYYNKERGIRMLDYNPKVKVDNYLSRFFELSKPDRAAMLASGVYRDYTDLEEAMCAVSIINEVCSERMFSSTVSREWKILIVENEESKMPYIGMAVAGILGYKTVSYGNNLKPIIPSGKASTFTSWFKTNHSIEKGPENVNFDITREENLILFITSPKDLSLMAWKFQTKGDRVAICMSGAYTLLNHLWLMEPELVIKDTMFSDEVKYIGIYENSV